MTPEVPDERRRLPSVSALLDLEGVRSLLERAPRVVVTTAVRRAVEAVRAGHALAPDDSGWPDRVARELRRLETPSLRRVINGTGVVLHTNLGRAPLAAAAIDAMREVAGGYSNLEYDLERGGRGSRLSHCVDLVRELTGAEDALVVNNCAAALVLALNTLADGREAVVSRGELIEIGGSFRVPEIMARSGARLREVGTTNRTHLEDYRAALGPETGAIVKVHRSNFELVGFTAEASLADLAPLASGAGLPLLFDFGSGLLISLDEMGLSGEPTAGDAVSAGATVTLMSGDKLLGGPQAGILAGSAAAIERCRRNPLTRAFRVDKLTIAALEATLRLYRDPAVARREVPALRMLGSAMSELSARAEAILGLLPAGSARSVTSTATVGGGAFPSARIPSIALAVRGDALAIDRALRTTEEATPVVGRIEDGTLLVDLRSSPPALDALLADALGRALGGRVQGPAT